MRTKKVLEKEYFAVGQDWYFDQYESAKVAAARWFVAFLASMVLLGIAMVAFTILLPLKTIEPIIIHRNTVTNETWVEKPKSPYTPTNESQVNADIVRYITLRESYSAADINQRFDLVKILSANDVIHQYSIEQANDNPHAPINILGTPGIRKVTIEDIVFIDQQGTQEEREFPVAAHNLAKVDFTTTTLSKNGSSKDESWVATVAWVYTGLPESQADAWENWSGFTVSTYRVDKRNVH